MVHKIFSEIGLRYFGSVDLDVATDFERFQTWIAAGHHADMAYLPRHAALRADPRTLLPSAKSAWIVGLGYFSGDRMTAYRAKAKPWIAQYARRRDYHKVLRAKCADAIKRSFAHADHLPEYRICVDSAPLLERALAKKVPDIVIGKNTMCIHKHEGSYFLLAVILIAEDPEPRSTSAYKQESECGTCRRCQVYCPTGALQQDYQIDARRCISYWTIEHRGTVPLEFWPYFKDYIFGCDICQMVCPFNRDAETSTLPEPLSKECDPFFLATMTEAQYLEAFAGTPLIRAKYNGLRRNGLIALAAMGDPRLEALIDGRLLEPDITIRETLNQAKEFLAAKVVTGP